LACCAEPVGCTAGIRILTHRISRDRFRHIATIADVFDGIVVAFEQRLATIGVTTEITSRNGGVSVWFKSSYSGTSFAPADIFLAGQTDSVFEKRSKKKILFIFGYIIGYI
jgi:hypothetical protein